jgi:ABC-type antimicrobial peptide transport system permease subunit
VTGEVIGKQRATIQIDQQTGSSIHRKHKFPIAHVNNSNVSGETLAKRPNLAGEHTSVAPSKPVQPSSIVVKKQLDNTNQNKREQQENKNRTEKRSEELDILNSIDATKKKIFDTLKNRHNVAHHPLSKTAKSAKANILQAATAKKLEKKQIKPVESLSLTQSLNIAKLEQLARIESIMAKKSADANKTMNPPVVETNLPTTTTSEKLNASKETDSNQSDTNRFKHKITTSKTISTNAEHQPEKDSKGLAKEKANSFTKAAKPMNENDILGKIMNDINKNQPTLVNQTAKKSEEEITYVIENFLYRILK